MRTYVSLILFILFIHSISLTAAGEVYFLPKIMDESGNVEIEIGLESEEYQAGQIYLVYDPECINITNFQRSSEFGLGGWNPSEGESLITFASMSSLSGNHSVGLFEVKCVKAGCSSQITFGEESAVYYPNGSEIQLKWPIGSVECPIDLLTTPQTSETESSEGIVAPTPTHTPTLTLTPTQTQSPSQELTEEEEEMNATEPKQISNTNTSLTPEKNGKDNGSTTENIEKENENDTRSVGMGPEPKTTLTLIRTVTKQVGTEDGTKEGSEEKPQAIPIGLFPLLFALIMSSLIFTKINGIERKGR